MSPKEIDILVEKIEDDIGVFLAGHCFVCGDKHEWFRRWGWKTDRVQVYQRGHLSLIVNFEVLIPPRNEPQPVQQHVGIIDLGQLRIGPTDSFRFPALNFFANKLRDKIISSLPLGIEWLQQFNTPQKCLENLLTPHVNPKSRGFKYRQRYLQELPKDLSQVCCLLNCHYNYDDDYVRGLFNVRRETGGTLDT